MIRIIESCMRMLIKQSSLLVVGYAQPCTIRQTIMRSTPDILMFFYEKQNSKIIFILPKRESNLVKK